jgi:hypothetical protein
VLPDYRISNEIQSNIYDIRYVNLLYYKTI